MPPRCTAGERADRGGQRERFFERAAAGALARDADLQQHVEAPRACRRARPVLDQRQLRERIDQEPDPQVVMAGQQHVEPVEVGIADHLVGDDGAPRTRFDAHGELVDGREGQAPGAAGQLLREQLGRHGGLAVRRQAHALALGIVLHPGDVVRQRRAADHGQRIAPGRRPAVPALLADVGGAARRGLERIALAAVVEDRDSSVMVSVDSYLAPAGMPVAGLHFAQLHVGAGAALPRPAGSGCGTRSPRADWPGSAGRPAAAAPRGAGPDRESAPPPAARACTDAAGCA